MASVSLYRKYRSQTFSEVVGQQHITATLSQAVADDRLHHAYLFTGPRGTGKTSTARILAKALNCERGPTPEPCNACTHCTAITEGSHVDVIEIDAASHGGVDDVRDLRDRVAFAPAIARTKVYIVDECHMLSTAGWNAFLKTLEEPPDHVCFVFATTEPHKVLDTILSRTQRFDFKHIDAPALAALVGDIAGREGIELAEGALERVVGAGDGSARDTLSVLDQVVAYTGPQVTAEAVAEVLGATPSDLLREAADGIGQGDVAGLCALVGRVADAGHDLRQFSRDVVEHLRSLFLLKVAPEAGLVVGTPERVAALHEQAGHVGRAELLRAMDLLTEAQAQMRRGGTRLALELALAKAALPEAGGDVAALAARLDRLERRMADGGPPSAREEPAAREDPEPATTDEEAGEDVAEAVAEAVAEEDPAPADAQEQPPGDAAPDFAQVQAAWERVLEAVKQRTRPRHAQLVEGRLVSYEGGTLTLEFRPNYRWHAEKCSDAAGQEIIGDAIERVLGVRPSLRCVVAEDGSGPAPASGGEQPAPDGVDDAEARAVAESEAAEAAGERPDADAGHDEAIQRLETGLGATVLDDERT